MKEFLKSSNAPYIVSIPILSEAYINKSKNLTQEQVYNIVFLEVLSPLQQEFKSWYYKLFCLHHKSIFRLATLGILPKSFLDIKYDVPLCESFMVITTSIKQWITKGNKSCSVCNYTDNNLKSGVLVDQL